MRETKQTIVTTHTLKRIGVGWRQVDCMDGRTLRGSACGFCYRGQSPGGGGVVVYLFYWADVTLLLGLRKQDIRAVTQTNTPVYNQLESHRSSATTLKRVQIQTECSHRKCPGNGSRQRRLQLDRAEESLTEWMD